MQFLARFGLACLFAIGLSGVCAPASAQEDREAARAEFERGRTFLESNYPNTPIRSAHPGGAWILFADGSTRFLAEGIETALFQNLAVRDTKLPKPITE